MTRYGQIGWRVAAVAAFIGTAALAVVLTRAPGNAVTALSAEVSSRACATPALEAWLGSAVSSRAGTGRTARDQADIGMSHGIGTYYTLEFTNVSHQACRLYGYPEVSAYQAGPVTGQSPAESRQVGAAVRDTSVRPRPVTLEPGATAHAQLRVVAAGSAQPAGCMPVTAEELRVTLPSQGRPAVVPAHIAVCSVKGSVSLSVQAIQARAGVPGHAATP